MMFFVKRFSGTVITLNVSFNDSVDDIKKKIFEKETILVENQTLVWGGKKYEDRLPDGVMKGHDQGPILIVRYKPDKG